MVLKKPKNFLQDLWFPTIVFPAVAFDGLLVPIVDKAALPVFVCVVWV